jgi:hypothetical protein
MRLFLGEAPDQYVIGLEHQLCVRRRRINESAAFDTFRVTRRLIHAKQATPRVTDDVDGLESPDVPQCLEILDE